ASSQAVSRWSMPMVAVATKRARDPASSAGPTFTVERTRTRSASRTAAGVISAAGRARTSPSSANAASTKEMLRSATMCIVDEYHDRIWSAAMELTLAEVRAIHDSPLPELLFRAHG